MMAKKIIDDLQENVERGAILRTVSLISNSLPIGVDTAAFSVELEEQDAEDGALLSSVDVFISFTDGSPDTGDSSGGVAGEVMVTTIPASEFTTGEFGLPRTTLTIPLTQMLSLLNLTNDNIFGGDTFTTRLVLNLTDGRSFTSTDVNGNIASGSFFLSPFRYSTPVVCPVEEGTFTGDYNVEQVTPSIFGYDTFDPDGGGVVLTLNPADEATQRTFDADYLAALNFGNTRTYTLNFICGAVTIPTGSGSGLQCSNGITLGPPSGTPGAYDFQDDSAFQLIFTDDESDDCSAGSPDVTLNWTKQ